MKNRIGYFQTGFPLVLFLFLAFQCNAEVKSDTTVPLETRMMLSYVCSSGDSVILTAGIMVKHESGPTYLANTLINFSVATGNELSKIGSIKTNGGGNAMLRISLKGLPRDKDGMITYIAVSDGIGKYPSCQEKILAKPARILIKFIAQDSTRTINVSAVEVRADEDEKPITKQVVILYVPRLFSLLKIGEVTLDDEGKGSIDFPGHLIGDSSGQVQVVGKIEENDLYNTVQGQNSINWGIPKHFFTAERPSRELWTPIAPIWMIITLIIMLTGVWAHYFYAVFQLFLIKFNSKGKNM